jgi:bifunctional non-homologous end joining protein LigD
LPVRGIKVPAGEDWLHEIKHDGYRLIVERDGKRVRLFTRNGHDWTDRYPLIVEAALRNRSSSFVLDGEAVLLGVDRISDFDGLHSRQHGDEVQLYAFDALALDGEDLRAFPLSMRKANLARLARRPDGVFVAPFEQGEIGPDLFRKACEFGLEGLVSKHRDRAYRSGTSPHWVKVKNPKHPRLCEGSRSRSPDAGLLRPELRHRGRDRCRGTRVRRRPNHMPGMRWRRQLGQFRTRHRTARNEMP